MMAVFAGSLLLWSIPMEVFLKVISVAALCSGVRAGCPQLEKVNPFIGTGGLAFGYGGVNPGAQYPHSPMRLGPDTTNGIFDVGYRHFSGYNYMDKNVRMFSHTHFVGAGINGLGNFGVMPVRMGEGEQDIRMQEWIYNKEENADIKSNASIHTLKWWSAFEKEAESASPGQYSVHLDEPSVDVTLLASSTHSAIHHYHFSPLDASMHAYSPSLILDVCHAAQVASGLTPLRSSDCHDATIHFEEDGQSFSASLRGDRDIYVYFYGELQASNRRPSWIVCSNGNTDASGAAEFSCDMNVPDTKSDNGVLFSRLSFGEVDANDDFTVELRIGISYISVDMAKTNLISDKSHGMAFADIKSATAEKWCSTFASVPEIKALPEDNDIEQMLFSAVYRSHLSPTIYTESGGMYLGLDNEIHNATQERHEKYGESGNDGTMEFYSDLSLWDTYRALHPWLLLTDENIAVGVLRSISEMTQQQDAFPRWVLASKDISCMVGLHGGALAVEAAKSGLGKEFDLAGIQEMLQHMATEPWPKNGRKDLDFYLENGYVSSEADDHSASLTLTFAYDDFVLSELSDLVGDQASADSAAGRAQNYRNIWSKEKEFMCPRSESGVLECSKSASSLDSWQNYVEGDGLHWSYFVVQDPLGLISLFNSTQDFEQQLEEFFTEHVQYNEKFGEAVPNPYFWQGNEVDHFSVWLFNYGQKCTLSQYWSRALTHMHFSNAPNGVPGNEDYGAMSSWLLFASFGLFPQAGTTNFLIGSPRVQSATLRLQHFDGTTSDLEIVTVNNSADNVYVSSLFVNGEEHRSTVIDRAVLADPAGCRLEFHMSSVAESALCN